jgi:hypothetical protein
MMDLGLESPACSQHTSPRMLLHAMLPGPSSPASQGEDHSFHVGQVLLVVVALKKKKKVFN